MADRVGVSGAAPIRGEGLVIRLDDEGGGNRRLLIRVPGWPGFEPGQFVMLSPGALASVARSDPLLPRPMAVYRERGECEIEILFKLHGRGTALLADLAPGQRLRVVVAALAHGLRRGRLRPGLRLLGRARSVGLRPPAVLALFAGLARLDLGA